MTNFKLALAAAVGFACGASAAQSAVIDLGFSLDESGSVGINNFELTRDALAQALSIIPTSGNNQYRVAITTYSNIRNQEVVVQPTIVTAASIGGIQSSLQATAYSGGSTCTSCAIKTLSNLFANSATGFGDTTLINITTDGSPDSQSASEQAALEAIAAGVDGISFEAVGTGINSQNQLNAMADIAKPDTSVIVTDINNIPNATQVGFVIPVASFADYEAAIKAKIGQIVIDTGDVPLPAGLPLLLTGFGAIGALRWRNKRKAA